MKLFILEAQKFYSDGHIKHPEWKGKFDHIGYVKKVFKSMNEAAEYYDIHHPKMRKLNSFGTWRSDWDPQTDLRYVVREYSGEYLKIEEF